MNEEPVYKYASALKPEPGASTEPLSTSPLSWVESDGSKHEGTEYAFDPASGLPHLRTEWVPRTDGAGYGLGILFMATVHQETGGGPSDYSFADAADHPDNEQHYRDTLWDPFTALFPDKTSVDLEDGLTVTVDDAVAEAVRRYRGWLQNIHPDPTSQLVTQLNELKDSIVSLADQHAEIRQQVSDLSPDAQVSAVLVQVVEPSDAVPQPTDDTPGYPVVAEQ